MAVLVGAALLTGCATSRRDVPEPVPAAQPAPVAPGARARNWDEYRMDVGRRIVAANPNGTYVGPVPEPLLAIPVLDIDLNRDGSVRRISVKRQPRQAIDTVQLAIDAVRRAGPFGDVSHLPQPWTVTEVFLFRDDRLFKPRSLDL
jgi:protein TonB